MTTKVEPSLLAQEWSQQLMALEEEPQEAPAVMAAIQRSLPLLQDAASVPFVCRYRSYVIDPLTTLQTQELWTLIEKHDSLASLRTKLLSAKTDWDDSLERRIQSSTSKSELQDLYEPFKPPSKGSILERIQAEHPKLVQDVDALWDSNGEASISLKSLKPRDALIHLVATKIAGQPEIMTLVSETLQKHCRVKTTSKDSNFRSYDNFSVPLQHLRNYQVLAIRRGISQKVIQMSYDIDGSRMESSIQWHIVQLKGKWLRPIVKDAVHDAWTRLLRRRGTTKLWRNKCNLAQERAMQVFVQNLHNALLAPPLTVHAPILAMDPGFQAGIKCAVLSHAGEVMRLDTVYFVGNKRQAGITQLRELLSFVKDKTSEETVVVALGNGHGSQEARALIQEAQQDIRVHLVNEAGASVWSVTQAARQEFPKEQPAAIAAISIGRRLLNPLHELLKVPPKSLGLGMYQHDLAEKELDDKLHLTSVDAVATVGVNVNTGSEEILTKVPGMTTGLVKKVIAARPLQQRGDLMSISGLGPKTFENCAAFLRVDNGPEPLDKTLVHPESYDLAKWLLDAFHWNLSEKPTDVPPKREWETKWESILQNGSDRFGVSRERVLAVIENLVDSMTNIDPRLRDAEGKPTSSAGSLDKCTLLSPELANVAALQKACPVRCIVATIRNIADFGAFVDFGGHNDGLLHTSKLGPVKLDSLLIGQQVGVDILSVDNDKVSLGLTGLNLSPDARLPGAITNLGAPAKRNFSSSSRANGNRGGASSNKRGRSSKGASHSHGAKRRATDTSSSKRRKTGS